MLLVPCRHKFLTARRASLDVLRSDSACGENIRQVASAGTGGPRDTVFRRSSLGTDSAFEGCGGICSQVAPAGRTGPLNDLFRRSSLGSGGSNTTSPSVDMLPAADSILVRRYGLHNHLCDAYAT